MPIFLYLHLKETCINQLHNNEKLFYQITYFNAINTYHFVFFKN